MLIRFVRLFTEKIDIVIFPVKNFSDKCRLANTPLPVNYKELCFLSF